MSYVNPKDLYNWCRIPAEDLAGHPQRRVPFRLVRDAEEMGQLMARELAEVIEANNVAGRATRAALLARALDDRASPSGH